MERIESLDDLVQEFITRDFLWSLPDKEFGIIMSPIAERYVANLFNSEFGTKFKIINGRHYDLVDPNMIRHQVKFRKAKGRTPYSQQLYTHNWRQKLQYGAKDFDIMTFVICHKNKREPKDWCLSTIPAYKCIDPNNRKKLLKNIPAKLLKWGQDWKKRFGHYLKTKHKKRVNA